MDKPSSRVVRKVLRWAVRPLFLAAAIGLALTSSRVVRKVLRWAVRLLFLAAAIGLALNGPLPAWAARIVPSLSPLAVLSASIAQRRACFLCLWGLFPLLCLLVALWKGRLFCRWVCPLGTLYALPTRLSLRKSVLRHRVSGCVFWTILFASLVGAPALLFLDPLSSFQRLGTLASGTYTGASLVLTVVAPVFLLAGFVQPALWCTHICPLGYFLETVRVRRWRGAGREQVNQVRRDVIVGLLVGLPLGALARRIHWPGSRHKPLPVLPPGARDPESFAAACSRCYGCVNACPTKVIRVRSTPGRSLAQAFQPELDPMHGACDEFCNLCSQVCPTGALQPLTLDEKRNRRIGIARINESACLAWTDHQWCWVCGEVCPYHAIIAITTPKGLPLPVVQADRCRGCGACQLHCPAIRMGKAIIVAGVPEQGPVADTS